MKPLFSQVSASELQRRLNFESPPMLVDVRSPMEFQGEHIDQAKLVPLDQINAPELVEKYGVDCETVLVCRSGKRATLAAEKLREAGMTRLSILKGGMQAWTEADLPIIEGTAVFSLERQVRIVAGLLILLGSILGTWVHPGFYGLSAFVGAGLVFAGLTDWCGMGLLLAKAPWNNRRG